MFNALEKAQAEQADVLLIDTAGRLHNKDNLMAELQKIARVIKKIDPGAPHDTVLVLDATTGQNAHAQVETFQKMANITGLIVTKLDGTARGGVLVALAEKSVVTKRNPSPRYLKRLNRNRNQKRLRQSQSLSQHQRNSRRTKSRSKRTSNRKNHPLSLPKMISHPENGYSACAGREATTALVILSGIFSCEEPATATKLV